MPNRRPLSPLPDFYGTVGNTFTSTSQLGGRTPDHAVTTDDKINVLTDQVNCLTEIALSLHKSLAILANEMIDMDEEMDEMKSMCALACAYAIDAGNLKTDDDIANLLKRLKNS